MRNRTRVIAAAAVAAALAAGSTGAAVASTAGAKPGAKPGAQAKTVSATKKPGGPAGTAGHDAIVAAVAQELHVSTARVSAALGPLLAAGRADTSSTAFAAAARSLGIGTQQLFAALAHAKQSLAGGPHAKQNLAGGPHAKQNLAGGPHAKQNLAGGS